VDKLDFEEVWVELCRQCLLWDRQVDLCGMYNLFFPPRKFRSLLIDNAQGVLAGIRDVQGPEGHPVERHLICVYQLDGQRLLLASYAMGIRT